MASMAAREEGHTTGRVRLQAGDALIVVDVQQDFLPGGALAVPDGDQVVAPLNRCIRSAGRYRLPVFFTRDWHPPDHCSFRARGGPWPPHCVAGSPGAAFAEGLTVPSDAVIVSKATDPDADAYSGFQGTALAAMLRERGCDRVLIGGLATDYCVLATVRDARAGGFQVVLLTDAVRAVDVAPGDGERAVREMQRLGTLLATADQVTS